MRIILGTAYLTSLYSMSFGLMDSTYLVTTSFNRSASVTRPRKLDLRDTMAPTFSPSRLSGIPMATASVTAGCAYKAFSTSAEVICGSFQLFNHFSEPASWTHILSAADYNVFY